MSTKEGEQDADGDGDNRFNRQVKPPLQIGLDLVESSMPLRLVEDRAKHCLVPLRK